MKTLLTSLILCLLLLQTARAQSCFGLKISGFRADNPDEIYLQATADIPANRTFYFTDNDWTASTENFVGIETSDIYTWTTPATGIGAGSVILISSLANFATSGTASGLPGLSNDGEQLYILSAIPSAVEGESPESTICFAINFLGTGNMPTDASKFVNLGDIDNAVYDGSGDFSDVANWARANSVANLTFPTPTFIPPTNLPVTLTSFKVGIKNTQNNLVWTTSSEVNNAHFDIERSSDATRFERIGTLVGKGNTKLNHTYQFTDESPKSGINYYRLKQVDFDGGFAYSRIVLAHNDASAQVTIRHFPENKALQIAGVRNIAPYKLFSLNGRLVKSGNMDPGSPVITYKNITSGVYILQMQNSDLSFTRKILID